MIRAVAKALDVDPDVLLSGSDEMVVREGTTGTFGATPDIAAGPGVGRPKFVPFISMAQAGTMSGNIFTDEAYAYEGTVAFDPEDRKAFGVKIVGDSMLPDYRPGDIVIAYPSFPPQNNKVVICRLNDEMGGEVLFKIYQARDNGRRVVLSSYNPAFPPVDVEREHFAWIYPVKGLSRRLD
jgi:phage repressor protein C with HTH and peptisase S24 domain